MTLIAGLNLSDRLYLGADTRVTFDDGSYNDDVIKVAHISGENCPIIGEKNPNVIFIAVAGNLKLATYLYQKIGDAIQRKELSDDIRILFKKIDEFIKQQVDEWLKENPYKNCCIMFAGMTDDRKKEIDLKQLEVLQQVIKKTVQPPEEREKIKKKLENDPFFKELAKKIPRKNLMRPFDEPYAMEINPVIQRAIDNQEKAIDAPDSLIFSVIISRKGISKEKAEWGEFLAYGTGGIKKNDLAEDFLAKMELSPGQLHNKEDLMETNFIRSHIMTIAQKNNINEIGGAVTPITLRKNMFKITFGYREMTLRGKPIEELYQTSSGIFFKKENEAPIKLINFFEYKSKKSEAQL